MESPEAQWSEHPTRSRRVWVQIPEFPFDAKTYQTVFFYSRLVPFKGALSLSRQFCYILLKYLTKSLFFNMKLLIQHWEENFVNWTKNIENVSRMNKTYIQVTATCGVIYWDYISEYTRVITKIKILILLTHCYIFPAMLVVRFWFTIKSLFLNWPFFSSHYLSAQQCSDTAQRKQTLITYLQDFCIMWG